MTRAVRSAVVAAAVAALTATTVAVAAPAAEVRVPASALVPAERGAMYTTRAKPLHVMLATDSALASIRWRGWAHLLDPTLQWDVRLESCRRIHHPSCRGREGYQPLTLVEELDVVLAEGGAPDGSLLLVSVGHNDWESRFRDDLETALAHARAAGFERVGWLNFRELVEYVSPSETPSDYPAMNDILDDVDESGAWPELVVIDYDAHTAGRDDWYFDDGVHLTPVGTLGVINWLNNIIDYSVMPELAPDNWQPA